ncbi:MAG: translation elongation factor Ts [Gemmatimonadetes bacterium]|nr:translation elongation factor Ts [Gemmatimonadota bacterium]
MAHPVVRGGIVTDPDISTVNGTMSYKPTPKEISELRGRTGAGIGDCKGALEETGGDLQKAGELLRKKGIAKAEKRAGRSASQGLVVIELAADGKSGGMIELNCETDFVAKTDDFIGLAKDLAKHVAAKAPVGVKAGSIDDQPFRGKTVAEAVKEVSGKTGEAMTLNKYARFTQPAGVVASYLHHNGQVGVLVDVEGPPGEVLTNLAKDVALHVASADPIGVSDADIPTDLIERERRIAEEQVAAEGKPEAIRGKIVDGKVKKFVAERVLLSQPFVKDESQAVGDLVKAAAKAAGGAVAVKRFARFKVGEA